MKNNSTDQCQDGYSPGQSDYKSYDEFNVLDPYPGSDLQFLEDEDDELSDYSLMNLDQDQDYYL